MSLSDDLDLLGAEGLAGQYVVLQVKSIDKQKLVRAVGGRAAAALPAALAVIDFAPAQALSLLLPVAVDQVRDKYGVDLGYQVTEAPPAPGQKPPGSGTTGKILLGVALGLGAAWGASHLGLIAAAQSVVGRIRSRA